jgi:N-acetylglucosamine malate deacetylase 1
MKILILAAHPDDEVLGCGGSIAKWFKDGHEVYVHIVSEGTTAQYDAGKIAVKRENAKLVKEILGIEKYYFSDYPDAQLDTVPLLELTKAIGKIVEEIKPEILISHHYGDTNQDHRRVFEAAIVVARPQPNSPIKKFMSYEVPSSSEWGKMSYRNSAFNPNYFVNITNYIDLKLKAIEAYNIELRPFPHPRSIEGIRNISAIRGQSVGIEYCEGYFIHFCKE